jgi:hypothetical protein
MLEYPRGMNQGLGIAFSLSRLGMLYGFYDASADAKRVGYERIETYCRREIYPDGSLAECSFNYNINCLSQLLELADLAARLHLAPPAGLKERLPAAARYMALTTDPLVRAPRLATGGGPIANFLRELNAMAKDPAIAFVASMGKEGTPPPKACATFPWVGCHVFRSGWGKDATWMLFEAGPRGNGHHDIAQLNVQLVSGGQVLLADPGFYTYSSAGEGGRMSEYLHTTAAHNAALVDGLGQIAYPPGSGPAVNERAGKYGWKDQANAAFAEGTYDYGFGEGGKLKVTHHRQVTYAKRANAFVIEDTFGGAGEHEVELHWQLEPKAKVDLAQDVGLAAVFVGRQPMQMTFSSKSKVRLEVFRGQKDPPGGWYSEGYGKLEPAPMIVVKVRGALPLDVMTRIEP